MATNLCQIMTANNSPSPYLAFSDTAQSGYEAYKAFDDVTVANYWGSSTLGRGIIGYYFGGKKYVFTGISMLQPYIDCASKDFTIDLSNDGLAWDTVATLTNQTSFTSGVFRDFPILTNKAYSYLRINTTALITGSNYCSITELKVYGNWGNFSKRNGVSKDNFSKILGISKTSIAKVNGITV